MQMEVKKMRKTIVDYILDEDYGRYQELLTKAAELKANAPRKPRAELTMEQKLAKAEAAKKRAEEKLNALLAQING
jgi:hypothetical protein